MRVIYQLDNKTTTIAHLLNNNSISDIANPLPLPLPRLSKPLRATRCRFPLEHSLKELRTFARTCHTQQYTLLYILYTYLWYLYLSHICCLTIAIRNLKILYTPPRVHALFHSPSSSASSFFAVDCCVYSDLDLIWTNGSQHLGFSVIE